MKVIQSIKLIAARVVEVVAGWFAGEAPVPEGKRERKRRRKEMIRAMMHRAA